jgi:hypothetical protein
MIKSKIDARERALELAVELCKGQTSSDELVVRRAEGFKSFLIGDAELPEFVSGVDDILEAVEIFKKQMPEFNKTDNGQMEFLLPAPQDRKLMTESEAEDFKAMLVEKGYIDEGANIIFGSGNNYKKSFDGFDLRLYINKRVGGYVVSSTMNVGEGVDAPRFTIADYDLDIDRIECAALKLYGCYCETINLDEGV